MKMNFILGTLLAGALMLSAQDVASGARKAAKATEKGAKVVA